ncbi:outer arm dynein light chain 1 [Atractiella rhizophila]|nr:outer arm dynein light chain 1 [Atractiella rhizophila]
MSFLSLPGLSSSRPSSQAPSVQTGPAYISSLYNYLFSTPSLSQGTKTLEISPVHLSYLILRWEDLDLLSIPESLLSLSDPFSLPSNRRKPLKSLLPPTAPPVPRDILSLRSVSIFSLGSPSRIGASMGSYWPWGSNVSEEEMLKKIWSFFSRLPALHLTFNPRDTPSPEIEDFDPPSMAILPLPFPSLQKIKLVGLDPAAFRWEKVRWGLKVLELEDAGDGVENGWSAGEEKWMGEKVEWMSLIHLSISSNSLTEFTFPPSSSSLMNLRSLSLTSNLLISVPSALSTLPHLSYLSLSNNLISTLHQIRTALPQNLTSLCLSHNRITTLTGIDNLISLEKLDIRHNLVEDILELSRPAMLPLLKAFWVGGNPCVEGKATNMRPEELAKHGGW